MKILKKLLSVVLTSTMVVGMSIGAFADGGISTGILDEPNIYQQDDELAYLLKDDSLSKQQKQILISKYLLSRSSSDISKTLDISYRWQDTDHHCVAACAEMILIEYGKDSPSQSELAKELKMTSTGAKFSNIEGVINNHLRDDLGCYVKCSRINEKNVKRWFSTAIAGIGTCPVGAIKTTGSDDWDYEYDSHAVLFVGQKKGLNKFKVLDPWFGYVGRAGEAGYWQSTDTIVTALKADGKGFYY